MSERWIKACRSALERVRKLSAVERKDRLDLVKSINTYLVLMGRSLTGWTRWVNNPNTMSRFSKEELEDMDKHISKFAESFIEYDLKITNLGLEKGVKGKRIMGRIKTRFVI